MNPARPYIIAELAQSHGGSIGQALLLMQAVAEAGATAVKFQDHRWEDSPVEHPPTNDTMLSLGRDAETRFEYLERGQFRTEEWHWLRDKAHDLKLDFIVSPFSVDAARDLVDLVDCWKVASGQVRNAEMHKVMARTGKPVFWSCGLEDSIGLPSARADFRPMVCTSLYPNPPKHWKVDGMRAQLFGPFCSGYSDHSKPGSQASLLAMAAGASVFERHVHPGKWTYHNDRLVSLDPGQFADYVRDLRNAWVALHEAETPDVEAVKGYFLK